MGEQQQEPRLTILKNPATLHQLEREREEEKESSRQRKREEEEEEEKSTKGGGAMRGKMDED